MFFYTFMPKLLNMSLTASVAIVLVILLRLLLKKLPKVISYALWGVVLFRLLCPVSISSVVSLYNLFDAPAREPGTVGSVIEYVPSDIVHTEYPAVALPVPDISDTINEALPQGQEQLAANPLEAPMSIFTYVWLLGVLIMTVYSVISYFRLRRKLLIVVPLRDNIFIADDIQSPFVIGLLRPKIYLPCNLGDNEREYVILHEQHHIRRLDHIIKALAFLALSIHWFNPLVWAAFILSGKDMEMSCDEAVIRKVGSDIRADYSSSLLTLATGRRIIAGTPLAFGEGSTKERIKNLANWKKPAFWVVLVAIVACIVLAVCLLTNPTGFQIDFSDNKIVSADCFDLRGGDETLSDSLNQAQIDELISRLDNVKNTKKSSEYAGFTPVYQISAKLHDGSYIRVSGYSFDNDSMIDIEYGSQRYVVSDTDFCQYLSRVCSGGDKAAAKSNSVAGKTYLYENKGIMGDFTISFYKDGTFSYSEGMASSYIGFGKWEQSESIITMRDDENKGYSFVNHFRIDGDDIVYIEENSSGFLYVEVKAGERFHHTGDAVRPDSEQTGENTTEAAPKAIRLDSISEIPADVKSLVITEYDVIYETVALPYDYVILLEYGNGLTDIAFISDFTQLEKLSLGGNKITDITPLQSLTNLETLDLSGNNITDITPLQSLTKLKELYLSHNITDITQLQSLTNLKKLDLSWNNITDITPLRSLTNLEHLDLMNNNIADITPLKSLTNLEYLWLLRNHIADITPLRSLTNLKKLDLTENSITDITPLKSLTKLEELELDDNNIIDITPLQSLINLKYLWSDDNNITDITPLQSLANLECLGLDVNNIIDITPLRSLTKLERLYLRNNSLTDITPLRSLTNLKYLSLDENNITDITPLQLLTKLEYLGLSANNITDIAPLQSLTNLEYLELNDNNITDTTPLQSLTKLKDFYLPPKAFPTVKCTAEQQLQIQTLLKNSRKFFYDYIDCKEICKHINKSSFVTTQKIAASGMFAGESREVIWHEVIGGEVRTMDELKAKMSTLFTDKMIRDIESEIKNYYHEENGKLYLSETAGSSGGLLGVDTVHITSVAKKDDDTLILYMTAFGAAENWDLNNDFTDNFYILIKRTDGGFKLDECNFAARGYIQWCYMPEDDLF